VCDGAVVVAADVAAAGVVVCVVGEGVAGVCWVLCGVCCC